MTVTRCETANPSRHRNARDLAPVTSFIWDGVEQASDVCNTFYNKQVGCRKRAREQETSVDCFSQFEISIRK